MTEKPIDVSLKYESRVKFAKHLEAAVSVSWRKPVTFGRPTVLTVPQDGGQPLEMRVHHRRTVPAQDGKAWVATRICDRMTTTIKRKQHEGLFTIITSRLRSLLHTRHRFDEHTQPRAHYLYLITELCVPVSL